MRLWTVQPLSVWDALNQNGVFRCDGKLAECMNDLGFEAAYRWMAKQMRRRVGPPPVGVSYPIWAWHTLDWRHKKPDLRATEFRGYDSIQACIEVDVPSKDALLSDEVAWHFVLNDAFIPDAANEEEFDSACERFDALPPDEQKFAKEASWEKIFDIYPVNDGWNEMGRYVQATFWELRLEEVKDVRFFGRNHTR